MFTTYVVTPPASAAPLNASSANISNVMRSFASLSLRW